MANLIESLSEAAWDDATANSATSVPAAEDVQANAGAAQGSGAGSSRRRTHQRLASPDESNAGAAPAATNYPYLLLCIFQHIMHIYANKTHIYAYFEMHIYAHVVLHIYAYFMHIYAYGIFAYMCTFWFCIF